MAYTGQISEIVVGSLGLTGTKNQATIDPTQLLQANNLTFESVTMRKEGGAAKYNSSAITSTPSVIGGHDWNHNTATQRMIVMTSNGKLLKDSGDGSFGVTLKTGLTTTNVVPVFVEGGKETAAADRSLYIFTGANQVQELNADGATTTNIASPPTDWGSNFPTFGLNHENRLWGGGNYNDPHRVYYSTTANHEDFSDNNSIAVFPGEGQKLVGAASFKGVIILWKFPKGIYIIDTTDPTVANWKVAKLSDSIGGVSPLGHTNIDDDIVFIDSSASFHMISAITEFGNLGTRSLSDVSDMNPFIRDNFNLANLNQTRAIFYPAKRELHFAMQGTGNTTNSHRVVIDFSSPQIPRFRVSDRDTPVSLWLKEDSDNVPRLTMGDNAGFVWNLDQDARSAPAGTGYQGLFQTPHLDLSHIDPLLASKRKIFDFLELLVEPKGNWNLSVDVIIDGETHETVQFNMGAEGSTLGSFVLNTNKLGGNEILNKRKQLTGTGNRISLIGYNSGDGQDFSVAKFLLYYRQAGEAAGT